MNSASMGPAASTSSSSHLGGGPAQIAFGEELVGHVGDVLGHLVVDRAGVGGGECILDVRDDVPSPHR